MVVDLPSGNLTYLLHVSHLYWIYPLKMVIVHKYVKSPEGTYAYDLPDSLSIQCVLVKLQFLGKLYHYVWQNCWIGCSPMSVRKNINKFKVMYKQMVKIKS